MVCTSVRWLFYNSLSFWFLEKFKNERNSGFIIIVIIFQGKLSESKTSGSGFVKNPQRTGGVHEITRKKLAGL